MHSAHVDCDRVTLSDHQITSFDVFAHPNGGRVVDWRHHSEGLVEAASIKTEIRVVLIVDKV